MLKKGLLFCIPFRLLKFRRMHLKGTFIILIALATGVPAFGQFKNIMVDQQDGTSGFVYGPAIAINPRQTNNIVAASIPGHVYFTKDTGLTWTQSKLSSPLVQGDLTVITDGKGSFYYFHPSDATEVQGGSETEKPEGIVMRKSEDGGETWAAGEPIAVNNPKDQRQGWATTDSKGNLFVTWTQFDKNGDTGPDCKSHVMFSMSKNGKKWSDPFVITQLSGNCAGAGDTPQGARPAVTYDGKVMVAWSDQGKLYLDRSFNGGELWLSNDIVVADQPGGSDLKIPGHHLSSGMPVLMTDNSKGPYRGSLYLVWADQRNGANDTDIWFTRSHNFGDNWSSPARVNDDGKGKHQYLPAMAVDPATGYLYIIYYDRRNYDDNRTDVYVAYSKDGGASFKNVLISEKPFTPEEDVIFVKYNDISAQRGIIAPIWTRVDDGKTSVWTAVIKQEELGK